MQVSILNISTTLYYQPLPNMEMCFRLFYLGYFTEYLVKLGYFSEYLVKLMKFSKTFSSRSHNYFLNSNAPLAYLLIMMSTTEHVSNVML